MGSRYVDKASLGSPYLEDRPDLYLFDKDHGNKFSIDWRRCSNKIG